MLFDHLRLKRNLFYLFYPFETFNYEPEQFHD